MSSTNGQVTREPITIIQLDRQVDMETMQRIKENFVDAVDDRPMLIVSPAIKVYEVEPYRLASSRAFAAMCIAATALILTVIMLILFFTRG